MSGLPDVISIGGFPIATQALSAIAGALVGYLVVGWRGTGVAGRARDLILNSAIGLLLGAKLIYLLLHPIDYWRSPGLLLLFPYGPLALPGAVLGAAVGVVLSLWRRSDWLQVLDQAAAPLALAAAVGLLGYRAPGFWAYAPVLGGAAIAALFSRGRGEPAGLQTARILLFEACALVLADLARPTGATVAGISALQLGAAVVGTAAWLWSRRLTTSGH
ncbi:MAG: prolipoprotein diacylglyceryl transferase family protein [Mycobacterium leprae]